MRTVVFVCALVLAAVATVLANHLLAVLLAGYVPDPRWIVLAVVIIPPLYFLPAVLAASKSHPRGLELFLVNLLLGWTLVGWLACLVWAAAAPGETKPYTPLIRSVRRRTAPRPIPEITVDAAAKAFEDLMARRYQGQITEAEYLSGRQFILEHWPSMPVMAG